MCMKVRGQLLGVDSHYMCPEDPTQVVVLGDKCLCPLSPLAGPCLRTELGRITGEKLGHSY